MTEKGFNDAFLNLTCPARARDMARVLCQPSAALAIVDDLDGETYCDDGSKFAEDGSFRPGIVRSTAEQKVYDTYYGDTTMLRIEGDIAYSKWVREMIQKYVPMPENKVYALMHQRETRPYMEILVLVAAIRKAFPDRAKDLIDTYVKNNQLYQPFWDGAMPYIQYLLP